MRALDSWVQAVRFRLHLARQALLRPRGWMHPARAQIHVQRTLGEWAADSITAAAGSWLFVGVHVAWFTIWLVLSLDINLLTLIVSLEAIFLATFVLMSQNRGAAKDRSRDDVEAAEVDEMTVIERQQLQILELLQGRALGQPAGQAVDGSQSSQQASQAPQMPHNAPSGATVPPKTAKGAQVGQPLTRRLSQRHPSAS